MFTSGITCSPEQGILQVNGMRDRDTDRLMSRLMAEWQHVQYSLSPSVCLCSEVCGCHEERMYLTERRDKGFRSLGEQS